MDTAAGNGTSNGTTRPTSTPTPPLQYVPGSAAAGNMVSALYVVALGGLTALFL